MSAPHWFPSLWHVLIATSIVVWLLPVNPARAAMSSDVADRRLTITGDGGDDIVSVTCSNERVKINGANPDSGALACTKLLDISIFTLGGEDVIDLTNVTAVAFPSMDEPVVYAGEGDDIATASPIGTFMAGGGGDDTLNGRNGPDRLNGDAGNDTIAGAGGFDTVGGETLTGPTVLTEDTLVAGTTTDTLSSIEAVAFHVAGPYDGTAFPGPQRISATLAASVQTGPANDTLVFAGGSDGSFDGGAGIDTIEGQLTHDADLDPDRFEIDGKTYSLTSIERGFVFWQATASKGGTVDARDWTKPLRYENWSSKKVTFLGGRGRDRATGGGGPDILKGLGGNDRLLGGAGNDQLAGGRGKDTCKGGPGTDTITGCER